MTAIKFILLGFFVKVVTGFDDTVTHVPVIASLTRTRTGKVAFTIGIFSSIITAIIIAIFFSSIIRDFPHYRYITAGLIMFLAAGIYFDIFVGKPRAKAEKKLYKLQKISVERFTKLVIIGYIASLATVLDDIIAYLPLFAAENSNTTIYSVIGILSATLFEIILVIYFSEKIAKIKHKEKFAAAGLVILSLLIIFEIL